MFIRHVGPDIANVPNRGPEALPYRIKTLDGQGQARPKGRRGKGADDGLGHDEGGVGQSDQGGPDLPEKAAGPFEVEGAEGRDGRNPISPSRVGLQGLDCLDNRRGVAQDHAGRIEIGEGFGGAPVQGYTAGEFGVEELFRDVAVGQPVLETEIVDVAP